MKKTLILLFVSIFALAFTACQTEKDKARSELKEVVKQVNADCPSQVDELTIWDNSEIADGYFYYNYTILEDGDNDYIAILESIKSEFKNTLKENLTNTSEFAQVRDLLVKAGLGIKYVYTGSESGNSIDFVFTPEEVAAL